MIEIKGLSLKVSGKDILKGLELVISEPGTYLILGENRSGKTALFNLLRNRLRPTSGFITIDGKDLFPNWREVSRNCAYLGESEWPKYNIAVRDYLSMYASSAGLSVPASDEANRYYFGDDFLGILDRDYDDLSEFERRICELVKLLYFLPAYLFVDGLFSNLDRGSAESGYAIIEKFVSRAPREPTVLVFSTLAFLNFDLFKGVWRLRDGRLEGLLDQARGDRSPYVQVLCGQYFYRAKRIEDEARDFRVIETLTNGFILEVRSDLMKVLERFKEWGIEVLEIKFL